MRNLKTPGRGWIVGSVFSATVLATGLNILYQQACFLPNLRSEQRTGLLRDYILPQYRELERLHLLAEIGLQEDTTQLLVVTTLLDWEGTPISGDTVRRIEPAAMTVDSVKSRWEELASVLDDADDVVSPSVYATYRQIRRMWLETQPRPPYEIEDEKLGTAWVVEGSMWGTEYQARWTGLNETLLRKVEGLLSLQLE